MSFGGAKIGYDLKGLAKSPGGLLLVVDHYLSLGLPFSLWCNPHVMFTSSGSDPRDDFHSCYVQFLKVKPFLHMK